MFVAADIFSDLQNLIRASAAFDIQRAVVISLFLLLGPRGAGLTFPLLAVGRI